jgi:O-antigen ligase
MRVPAISLHVTAGGLSAFLVASAMGTSSIVFSEPALADALMLGVIFGIPVLGQMKIGRMALLNLALWLGIVALGFAGACMSTNIDTAIKHQVVTLFLALGAFVLGSYVAADPVPRMRLILVCFSAGCLVATLAAFAGYFNLVPGIYELFTNYGRARGTFKDPNVYGAAMVPAIAFALWCLLRESPTHARIAGAAALFLLLGVLISFSRGAWASTVFTLLIVGWLVLVRGRRRSDRLRFGLITALGTMGLAVVLGGALQLEAVQKLLVQRASLEQSYDMGPEGRFGGQAKAVGLILENPFGVGTHSFRDTYHPEQAHNIYLTMFLSTGWLGGLLYILSVAATLLAGFRGALRNGPLQGPLIVATAVFAGLVFEGFVIDTDHWRHFFIFMGCIWGLTDAAAPAVDRSRRRGDGRSVATGDGGLLPGAV